MLVIKVDFICVAIYFDYVTHPFSKGTDAWIAYFSKSLYRFSVDMNRTHCLLKPFLCFKLRYSHGMILIHHQVFNARYVIFHFGIGFNLTKGFKDHQRKVNIAVTIKTTDVFIKYISLFLCPCICMVIIINHFIDALQKQVHIARIGFQIQVAHATFVAVSCYKEVAFYGIENLIFPKGQGSVFSVLSGTFLPFIRQIHRHSGALVSTVYAQSNPICGHVCGRFRSTNVESHKQRTSDA